MQQRSLLTVFLLSFFTLGIYVIVWFVKTKGELNTKGAQIPSAWWLLVPIGNLWWMYKYFEGAEQVTNEKINGILYFLLGFFITPILPQLMAQSEYNKMEGAPATPAAASTTPTVPPQETTPTSQPPQVQ